MSELFNTREAADFLKVSTKTMERWRAEGGGPKYCKYGRVVLYRRGEIESWLTANTFGSTSEYQAA